MATAFLSLSRLFAAVRGLLASVASPGREESGDAGSTGEGRSAPNQPATPPRSSQRRPVWQGPVRAPKPLRVVRVLEPSAPRSTAGRMVISGRLADVCAELDRLAGLEAQGC